MQDDASTRRGATPSKQELRRALVRTRRAMAAEEVATKSRLIARRLLEVVSWPSIGSLHVYRAVAAWREVETEPIVSAVRARWPHVEISRPGQSKDEPIPRRPFDLILVPVLGFDRSNRRLGLGGGFYDRFLADQPAALTIGLAYRWALLPDGVPWEPHDVPLDRIVTDAETYDRPRAG